MDEEWRIIQEFSEYEISNYGEVINRDRHRHIRASLNKSGIVKVGLMRGGVQYTRSIKVLVAEAFVPGQTDVFDTPIQLDGRHDNNRADNLAWRPRWFAWKYVRQFVDITPQHTRGPIVDVETNYAYHDMFEAAQIHGLLVYDIWRSILTKNGVFPTWQIFVFQK